MGRTAGHRWITRTRRWYSKHPGDSDSDNASTYRRARKKAKLSSHHLATMQAIEVFERAVDRMNPSPTGEKKLPANAKEWFDELQLTIEQRDEVTRIIGSSDPSIFMLSSVEYCDLAGTSLTRIQKKAWILIGKQILK